MKSFVLHTFVTNLVVLFVASAGFALEKPNFLFITWEDVSPRMGCYGDGLAHSPTIDQLASEGILYENAYAVSGVCAPSRSAIMSGRWPVSLGSHHMRSDARLDPALKCFPAYLREAGYYCYNAGKTDYNFSAPEGSWDVSQKGATWDDRPAGKPFLGVYNFVESHQGPSQNEALATKHRNRLPEEIRVGPEDVTVPPYYPDTPAVRQQIANVYNNIAYTDRLTAKLLEKLEADGLAEDTIIIFYGDHGDGIPRVKGHLYHESLRVPLVVYIPEKFRDEGTPAAGSVVEELVSLMDLGPTAISLAGLEPFSEMDGRPFLGEYAASEPPYLYGHRDRVNSGYGFRRSVRDRRWHYIRNFRPDLAPHPPVRGHVNAPIYVDSRRLHDEGRFTGEVAAWLEDEDVPEHLYDTENDPHCVHNLAGDPEHAAKLKEMRSALREWQIEERDLGFVPESVMIKRARQLGFAAKLYHKSDVPFGRHHDLAVEWQKGEAGKASLKKLLDATDGVDRYWAVLGVGQLNAPDAEMIQKLQVALDDEIGAVARAATWSLYRLGITNEETLAPLRKVLKKGNYAERLEAIQVARRIGPQARSLVPELKRLVNLKGGTYYDRYLPSAAELALDAIQVEEVVLLEDVNFAEGFGAAFIYGSEYAGGRRPPVGKVTAYRDISPWQIHLIPDGPLRKVGIKTHPWDFQEGLHHNFTDSRGKQVRELHAHRLVVNHVIEANTPEKLQFAQFNNYGLPKDHPDRDAKLVKRVTTDRNGRLTIFYDSRNEVRNKATGHSAKWAKDTWPHFLVNQRFLQPVALADFEKLEFGVTYQVDQMDKLSNWPNAIKGAARSGMNLKFMFYLRNPDDMEQRLFAGMMLYTSREKAWAPHLGIEQHGQVFYRESVAPDGTNIPGLGDSRTVERDIKALIAEALRLGKEKQPLLSAEPDDYAIYNFSIGFEGMGHWASEATIFDLRFVGIPSNQTPSKPDE